MSIFRKRKVSVSITEKDPTYKVRYLGNVQTSMMKGDGCVDKPTAVLWNNYTKTANAGIEMKLSLCATGMKAYTKEQGLTEYRAHRISYCIAHPKYPKLFVWVYRHEGKKMKVELRCHAVLCKSDSKAKVMAIQLHEKLTEALNDFKREKTRRQNTRLLLQRTNSLPSPDGANANGLVSELTPSQPTRTKFLSQGQNFKPSINLSTSAPKLGSISEDGEEEIPQILEEDEDELLDAETLAKIPDGRVSTELDSASVGGDDTSGIGELNGLDEIADQLVEFQLGNDIEELRRDTNVRDILSQGQHSDSDDDSSESSGFSEQEQRDHFQNENCMNGLHGSLDNDNLTSVATTTTTTSRNTTTCALNESKSSTQPVDVSLL